MRMEDDDEIYSEFTVKDGEFFSEHGCKSLMDPSYIAHEIDLFCHESFSDLEDNMCILEPNREFTLFEIVKHNLTDWHEMETHKEINMEQNSLDINCCNEATTETVEIYNSNPSVQIVPCSEIPNMDEDNINISTFFTRSDKFQGVDDILRAVPEIEKHSLETLEDAFSDPDSTCDASEDENQSEDQGLKEVQGQSEGQGPRENQDRNEDGRSGEGESPTRRRLSSCTADQVVPDGTEIEE